MLDGRRVGRDLGVVEEDPTLTRDQAGDRPHQGRLAGTVGADDDGQARLRFEREIAQHQEAAVAGSQPFDAEVGGTPATRPRGAFRHVAPAISSPR